MFSVDETAKKLCRRNRSGFDHDVAAYGSLAAYLLSFSKRQCAGSFADSHHRFDQCGVVLYLDSENWLKASVEYENEEYQHLGSVVTNGGYSDWATTELPASVKTMWYRLSRREDDYCIECSTDGTRWKQMRICHMAKGGGTIRFGIYACSPEASSFTAVFSDMQLTDCAWKAHDGQQPDET